jgi:pimeloyl-ACP methyl ester carboxylesterase
VARAFVHSVEIHYQRMGHGTDVVMIHGLGASLAFYLRIWPALAKEYRVTVYDLRGHGRSSMPPNGYTSAEMAYDLDGLLDHLRVETVNLVGHSFGGAVALEYAALRPERVTSITLADVRISTLQPTQPLHEWPRWSVVRNWLQGLGIHVDEDETAVGYRLLEKFARARIARGMPRLPGGFAIPFAGLGGDLAARRWLTLLRTTTAKQDFRIVAALTVDQIRQISRPVLLVYGEKSYCLPSLRALQQHLPCSRAEIVPDAGHFHPLLRPELFVRLVRPFLAGVTACAVDGSAHSRAGRFEQRRDRLVP